MIITHKLEMDLLNREPLQQICAVQGDSNTRVLELSLLSGGAAWTVPEDAAVWMRYCKSDGTKGIYDTLPDGSTAWSIEANKITVTLAPQMLTVPGLVQAQAELVRGISTLATFTIPICVERNPAAGVLKSEEYINMLQWMESELDRLLLQAKESGEFTGPSGEDGAGVFEYAQEAGFVGTEDEFAEMLITPCLPLAGGTMAGAVNMGGQALSGLITPTADKDAATKAYVDQKRYTTTVVLQASAWTEEAPYTQTAMLGVLRYSDWPRVEPVYTGVFATDMQIRAAYNAVSYTIATDKGLYAVCLDSKPETDLTLFVEILR